MTLGWRYVRSLGPRSSLTHNDIYCMSPSSVPDQDHANQEQEVPSVLPRGAVHHQKVINLPTHFTRDTTHALYMARIPAAGCQYFTIQPNLTLTYRLLLVLDALHCHNSETLERTISLSNSCVICFLVPGVQFTKGSTSWTDNSGQSSLTLLPPRRR